MLVVAIVFVWAVCAFGTIVADLIFNERMALGNVLMAILGGPVIFLGFMYILATRD